MRTPAQQLVPGSVVRPRSLTPVCGGPVGVPDGDRLIHLQFRRFAGCPVCNLHLRSVVRRHGEIEAAKVREVVVFHSPAEELRPYAADLPFAVIADPARRLYAEFGVESARRALLDPRAWPHVLRALLRSTAVVARGREHLPSRRQPHGRLGLPADVLLSPGGTVLAAKYGEHAYDQWTVDEVLELASGTTRPAAAHLA
ncbi:redoxin domain-containing protein [Streptomyces sp. WAC05374]|uniref:AhpC/TSA family protein n=1 Tax=Streptomyces sp. WAC05374 TaxID=2487420 RepID=UPI000F879374|nr:AhpC/TSA family protein [Streptomyces sp. WAC05374]RST16536.1 AhpC/TSA family protein [Streptomyces sp. WAC05374]TDF54637.1 redoxin domain-containing protein [Streptomyces sp. WAC05374]TDF56272.1 redoxin domain-containing protein [Streptomyces sp. WAC05374]